MPLPQPTDHYSSVFTQANHETNPRPFHFPIMTPDGGVLMASSVADAERIVTEMNRMLNLIDSLEHNERTGYNEQRNPQADDMEW